MTPYHEANAWLEGCDRLFRFTRLDADALAQLSESLAAIVTDPLQLTPGLAYVASETVLRFVSLAPGELTDETGQPIVTGADLVRRYQHHPMVLWGLTIALLVEHLPLDKKATYHRLRLEARRLGRRVDLAEIFPHQEARRG